MDCVTAQQKVKSYLGGYLSDQDLKEFLDHVEGCPSCFSELEVYFSVYRTLNSIDEKGDYNYDRKLREKLMQSREYLRRRQRRKFVKVGVIVAAECTVGWAFWALITLPSGYLDRHRTETVPVVDMDYYDKMSAEIPETVAIESAETAGAGSVETVTAESMEAADAGSAEMVEAGSMEAAAAEAVPGGASEAVPGGASEAVAGAAAAEAVPGGASEAVPGASSEAVPGPPSEAVSGAVDELVLAGPSGSVQ